MAAAAAVSGSVCNRMLAALVTLMAERWLGVQRAATLLGAGNMVATKAMADAVGGRWHCEGLVVLVTAA